VGVLVEGIAEADLDEEFLGLAEMFATQFSPTRPEEPTRGEAGLVELGAKSDVVTRSQEREEGVLLVDNATVTAGSGDGDTVRGGVRGENPKFTLARGVGANDGAEQGGLATSARTDEGEELAAAQTEVNVVQNGFGAEAVGDGAALEGEGMG
jgi:hypothetical protein